MQKAGGIISLIAGIFGIIAAFFTLLLGGIGATFGGEGANVVIWLGWGGVLFSFIVIVMGAVAINAKSRIVGIMLIISSLIGAVLGGTLVAVFMVLALIGGILVTIGIKKIPVIEGVKK